MQFKFLCSFTHSLPSCTCILAPSSFCIFQLFSSTGMLLLVTLLPPLRPRPLHERLCNLCAGRVLKMVCVGSVCFGVFCFLAGGAARIHSQSPKLLPTLLQPFISSSLRTSVFVCEGSSNSRPHALAHALANLPSPLLQLSIFPIEGRFCGVLVCLGFLFTLEGCSNTCMRLHMH